MLRPAHPMLTFTTIAAAALLIEAAAGYPAWLFARLRHPVMAAGAAVAWLDTRLNCGGLQRGRGVLALAVLLAGFGLPAWALQAALLHSLPPPLAVAILAVLAATLLAQRSLWDHVQAVARALPKSLVLGRAAVAHIVGRDPNRLDEAAVARAAIESLAENFSDGVVAPALWCALLGLPGIVLYKVVNTADSMVGHRTPRHEGFGWAAARLDDAVNLPASRLSGLLLALASGRGVGAALRAMARDARHHRSPNAGWPEAAMAGALRLRLAGPRVYGGEQVEDAWMGHGRADATAADIARALVLYRRACVLLVMLVAGAAWLWR